jgi:hypothetical protein
MSKTLVQDVLFPNICIFYGSMAKEGHRCKNADHLDSARSITMETRKWAFNDITGALAMSRDGRGNWLGQKI